MAQSLLIPWMMTVLCQHPAPMRLLQVDSWATFFLLLCLFNCLDVLSAWTIWIDFKVTDSRAINSIAISWPRFFFFSPIHYSVSGETPSEPVVSKKTGHVFEQKLIQKFLETNGKCPITGESMTMDDLIVVNSALKLPVLCSSITNISQLTSSFSLVFF